MILKPNDWVPHTKITHSFDNGSSAMTNLAVAAAQRSQQQGEGRWLVDTLENNDSDEDSDVIGELASGIKQHVEDKNTTDQLNNASMDALADQLYTIVPTINENQAIGFDDQDSDDSNVEIDVNNSTKPDRRKSNHGATQRNSYSKDQKLAAIGMRDQGKCSDEISFSLGVPKSNVEKWCSAKGREKIMKDLYRTAVSQNPRGYTNPKSNDMLSFPIQSTGIKILISATYIVIYFSCREFKQSEYSKSILDVNLANTWK